MPLDAATPAFLDALTAALPTGRLRPVAAHMLEEPRGRFQGQAAAIASPASIQEVACIVRLASQHRVGLIPYGGGTGLVGGQTAAEGPAPLLLSMAAMNSIRDLDPTDNAVVAEAGVILADLQAAAEKADRLFPLSLAAEGTATIGGNLATNAGGLNVIRYGNARDLCLGVEAVMPDGQILSGLKRLRKDNTGYDLRHLLIGSEGTLGIITAASLRLFPKPEESATALVAVASPEAALALLSRISGPFDGALSAFELIHKQGPAFLAETMPQIPCPWPGKATWSVLMEVDGPRDARLPDRLESALMSCLEDELAEDVLIAQNLQQARDFWGVREAIPEANRRIGSVSSHDISVPVSQIPTFIAEGTAALAKLDPVLRVNCFGHVGDGNLHYNVFPPHGGDRADWNAMRPDIKRTLHDICHSLGGSVSAEHGIGRLKTGDLVRYGDPTKLACMATIKAALDPVGIMNPGAVLPVA